MVESGVRGLQLVHLKAAKLAVYLTVTKSNISGLF